MKHKYLLSLSVVLLFSVLWSLPALADGVTTDRSCGSSAVFFTGETVSITFWINWTIWFQSWSLTVYDAQGNTITNRSGTILPFFGIRQTIYVSAGSSRPRGGWYAVLRVSWGFGSGRHTCDFTVADESLSAPSSPTRFINKGQSHLYRLWTNSGTSYTATLICNWGNDFDLYLLDRNLNTIRSSTAPGCPDAIFFTASDSVYYLKVVAASGSDWYQLKVF
jgi:hypothetical protein